jgi:hypothetical protein
MRSASPGGARRQCQDAAVAALGLIEAAGVEMGFGFRGNLRFLLPDALQLLVLPAIVDLLAQLFDARAQRPGHVLGLGEFASAPSKSPESSIFCAWSISACCWSAGEGCVLPPPVVVVPVTSPPPCVCVVLGERNAK